MPKNEKQRWADEEEEEDTQQVQTQNNKGIQERVKIVVNSKNQNVKITTKVKVKEAKIRVPLRVEKRKNLPRFGEAKIGEENVTIPSRDFVLIEHPDDQINDDSADSTLQKTLSNFITKQHERELAREFNLEDELDNNQETDNNTSTSNVSKYVAPGARRTGGTTDVSGREKEGTENTIRVSNLTKAVTEADLRDLFERFGRIHRVSLPSITKPDGSKEPKGVAFIAYFKHEDAQLAFEKLQNHGYDHLILKLEWAKPPKDLGGGGGGTDDRYRQGYGKNLIQDTKEKVLYASNLTGNY